MGTTAVDQLFTRLYQRHRHFLHQPGQGTLVNKFSRDLELQNETPTYGITETFMVRRVPLRTRPR